MLRYIWAAVLLSGAVGCGSSGGVGSGDEADKSQVSSSDQAPVSSAASSSVGASSSASALHAAGLVPGALARPSDMVMRPAE